MAENNRWDAIVIGSGLGGLTAAAALAAKSNRVLVVERLSNLGGAATVYRHGSLTMEASLHETDGETALAPDGIFHRLGIDDMLEPVATNIFYEVRGGALPAPVQVPHGLGRAEAAVTEALPQSREALRKFFHEVTRLNETIDGLHAMASKGPGSILGLVFSGRLFEFIDEARRTLGERFDKLFGDDEAAKMAVGAMLGYLDDDPNALSYAFYAHVWAQYISSGSYYFRGGSAALTMALAKKVHEGGGALVRKHSVDRILTDEDGAAAGVSYIDDNGARHDAFAPVIFGGAAPDALARMLPEGERGRFADSFERFENSISLFSVSLGLNRPAAGFGVGAYSTFIYPDDLTAYSDYPRLAARFGAPPQGLMPPYALADYGRLDTGLRKPDDPYLVAITGVDRFAWWDGLSEEEEMARRAAWIEALIGDVDRRYPGFADAVVHKEIATARTMKNRLGTPHGEVYGFRPTPARLFSRPPTPKTTVDGLFLSSAYTVSGGYTGAMMGGLMAADAAMKWMRDKKNARAWDNIA